MNVKHSIGLKVQRGATEQWKKGARAKWHNGLGTKKRLYQKSSVDLCDPDSSR
jgi:hypothetical protein